MEDRCLWLDEAMLAVNIEQRGFQELLGPLKYDQAAPVGFLWLQRVVWLCVTDRELAARLVPFMASCAALIIARKQFFKDASPGSLAGAGLFGLSPSLVCYAGEGKPYSLEVLASTISLALGLDLGRTAFPRSAARRVVVWSVIGPWFSYASVFFLPGLLWAAAIRRRELQRWSIPAGIGWTLASLLVLYCISIRNVVGNTNLRQFWAADFLPYGAGVMRSLEWMWFKGMECLVRVPGIVPFDTGQQPAFSIAALLTTVILALIVMQARAERGNPHGTLQIVLPGICAIIASVMAVYPFGNRLLLFLTPCVCLGVAGGLNAIPSASPAGRYFRILMVCLLLTVPVTTAVDRISAWKSTENPFAVHAEEDIRPLLRRIESEFEPGDLCYVFHACIPACELYSGSYDLQGLNVVSGTPGKPGHYREEVRRLLETDDGQVFALFSHTTAWGVAEAVPAMEFLSRQGAEEIRAGRDDDAVLYTVRRTSKPKRIRR